jgi:putative transposase
MDEVQSRYEAIRRHLAGDRLAEMCRALGRSKPWLYKWLTRDEPANPAWTQSRSRAPHHLAVKTPQGMERLICETRQQMVRTRQAARRFASLKPA